MNIFGELFDLLEKDKQVVTGLNNELRSIYIYNYFRKYNKSIVVVTNSLYEASNLYQSLTNYSNFVLLFPMDDFLTSEAIAISPELKIKRLETLNNCLEEKPKILITNLMGYLRFLPKPEIFKKNILEIKIHDQYPIDKLIEQLYEIGYTKETLINKTGEMAVRGFVLDVFPNNYSNPIRIEYWGDEIESIRFFDIDSQKSNQEIFEVRINPNTEFLTNGENGSFIKNQKDLLNYGEVYNISEYLNNPIVIYLDFDRIKVGFSQLVEEIYNYNISQEVDPKTKYMNDLFELKNQKEIFLMNFDSDIREFGKSYDYYSKDIESFQGTDEDINKRLNEYLKINKTVLICVSNDSKVHKIINNLNNPNIIYTSENNIFHNKINIIIKAINQGFEFKDFIVISEKEIFNKKESVNTYKSNFKMGVKIRDINKLNTGDYIVHAIHGIGKYIGMTTIMKNGLKKDYLQINYKNNDKLYIPVEKIDLISKYSSSDGGTPKINKLGGTEWAKTKQRVKAKIENIAGELFELYVKREMTPGFAFVKDDETQFNFEKEFPYQETADQIKVSDEIKRDMESPHPMDRLLCGDVGFGKTEVAFRAAFKAVLSGKQVMLLCPTTILANQHYNNAIERFKSFPLNIELLTRFSTKKEVEKITRKLKDGKVDILIGTHRVLSKDVIFNNLGLLIIDEEQRFGVKQKEAVKKLKANIDVLTLTATPIPRTIQMSLTGLRSLSLIETPPTDRYPIQTYVLPENNQIIRDAVYKELSRGGQVFILYNHIDDIPWKINEMSRLIPDAKITYAHGQMPKTEIENVMEKFIKREYNVLICTTIIETGIDIPSVNTLIIIDADKFGLSQLYQIRGRVGRSNKIAYCYLMYNKKKILSEVATKRLRAIKDFTELGSGFAIAMRDLSIRGAGDILGSEQAGFIDSVGTELFIKMLNEEVDRLKGIEVQESVEDEKPFIDVATNISDEYVQDEEIKIDIHKKINEIDSLEKLYLVKEELEDRFGKINQEILIYMYEELFEHLVKRNKIFKVSQTKNFIEIIIDKEQTEKIDGANLFAAANQITRMFRFTLKNKRLSIILDTIKLEKHFIYYLVDLMLALEKTTNE